MGLAVGPVAKRHEWSKSQAFANPNDVPVAHPRLEWRMNQTWSRYPTINNKQSTCPYLGTLAQGESSTPSTKLRILAQGYAQARQPKRVSGTGFHLGLSLNSPEFQIPSPLGLHPRKLIHGPMAHCPTQWGFSFRMCCLSRLHGVMLQHSLELPPDRPGGTP